MIRPIDNTCDLHGERTAAVASLHEADEYSRSEVTMALELSGGESRGYWKYHVPDKKCESSWLEDALSCIAPRPNKSRSEVSPSWRWVRQSSAREGSACLHVGSSGSRDANAGFLA
jgi:hypothetical protein